MNIHLFLRKFFHSLNSPIFISLLEFIFLVIYRVYYVNFSLESNKTFIELSYKFLFTIIILHWYINGCNHLGKLLSSKIVGNKQDRNLLPINILIGFSIYSFTMILLSLLNLYYAGIILIVTQFLFLLGIYQTSQVNYNRIDFKSFYNDKPLLITFIILSPFIIFSLLRGLLPETSFDSLVYHFEGIKTFLRDGTILANTNNLPLNFPFSTQLLFSPFLIFSLDNCIRIINFLLSMTSIYFLYDFTRNRFITKFPNQFSTLLVILISSSPYYWHCVNSPNLEAFLASYVVIYYSIYLNSDLSKNQKYLIGLPILGIIAGTKSIGLLFAIIELARIVTVFISTKGYLKGFKANIICKLVCITLLIFPSFFWYAKNYLAFNSAFYPKQHLAGSNIDSTDQIKKSLNYKAANTPIISELSFFEKSIWKQLDKKTKQDKSNNLFDILFRQGSNSYNFSDIGINPILILSLIPAWLAYGKVRGIFFSIISWFLILIFKAHIIRYVVPTIPLLSLITILNINYITEWIYPFSRKILKYFLLVIIIVILACYFNSIIKTFEQLKKLQISNYYFTSMSDNNYLLKVGYSGKVGLHKVNYFINHLQDKHSKLMTLGLNPNYYLKRKVINDQDQTGRQMTPWLELIQNYNYDHKSIYKRLKSSGVEYIFFDLTYNTWAYHRANYWLTEQSRLSKLDLCDPELLRLTMIDFAAFSKEHMNMIYMDYGNNLFLFKLK